MAVNMGHNGAMPEAWCRRQIETVTEPEFLENIFISFSKSTLNLKYWLYLSPVLHKSN